MFLLILNLLFRGILLDRVLINLLKVYCDPGNLVIVLNTSDSEEKYYKTKIDNEHVHVTTYSTNVTERQVFVITQSNSC